VKRPRYFHGWNVVAGTLVIATFSFGLEFYGITVYLGALQQRHAWSAATVSVPVTVYYLAGALLTAWIATLYERLGPRVVVATGSVALALGVSALGHATRPWHLYPPFLVMALGWGAMSGAALNILVAPWFERRRGLAVSLAFNGATLGGVLVAPALIPLIARVGFARAALMAGVVTLAALLPIAALVMRAGPHELGVGPDGGAPRPRAATSHASAGRAEALRTWRFWSVSAPFALALAAQVGLLTHVVGMLTPVLGVAAAGRAVSVTTAAAILGRLATGLVVDRVNPRAVTSVTLAIQLSGVLLLAASIDRQDAAATVLYAACTLFGLGVGNLTTLPGIILGAEWPRERFAGLVGMAVAINQCTFAFGPSLVGGLRDATGSYALPLLACGALEAIAAVTILARR
jgi:MFS family permease